MKQNVKMLSTQLGVDEGKIYPDTYFEGEEYAIGDELLACFVSLGAVELIESGEKSEGDAPENKMIESAPENKTRKSKKSA